MDAMHPDLVGITLNFRDAARTMACVQSLLEGGVQEILVWDNSADSGASAEDLARRLRGNPSVHIETSPANLGFAAGVNAALAWVASQWGSPRALLINNDARLLPGGVAQLGAAMDGSPHATVVYPAINHGGRILGTVHYHRWLGLFSKRRWPGSFPFASGCCMLINLAQSGAKLFDEDFFMYGEDIELGWRLGGGVGLVHVPEVLVDHEGSASSGMGTSFYEARMVAAHWILVRKLARNQWEAVGMYAARLIVLTARAALRSVRYRSLTPLRMLREGFRIRRGKDLLR